MADSNRARYHPSRETIPEEHRHHYDAIAESRGGVRGPFSILLNSPELAGRVGHLGAFVRFESDLPDADRELTILATARAFDCVFEWAVHEPIAREAGVSGSTIDVVPDSARGRSTSSRLARRASSRTSANSSRSTPSRTRPSRRHATGTAKRASRSSPGRSATTRCSPAC
ncbi:carboxymuconolactone decarboxylase family protein [Halopenitus malekzadehii]|uniref:carboxymuconolactone decarboxylase family protein n=1 Tax=Halopenitus malekzadehii TaxID=1267564 RepID=UPI000B8A0C6F